MLKLSALLLFAVPQVQPMKFGAVELFGHTGLDEKAIRAAITVAEDESYVPVRWEAAQKNLVDAVGRAAGKKVEDVSLVGFDDQGRLMVFIGISGPTTKTPRFRSVGRDRQPLPGEGLQLVKRFGARLIPALQAGQSQEDRSQGFSLWTDPELRAISWDMRRYALKNEEAIIRVLGGTADAEHRRAAAQLLGYAQHSKEQVEALLGATMDPDEGVRNNAIRALGVIATANEEARTWIPAKPFVDMVRSPVWSDRNKGGFVLEVLTAARNPELLNQVRPAVPSLLEMARWKSKGHRDSARRILGRVGGIPEEELNRHLDSGNLKPILDALEKKAPD